jgi:hypothetical protein
MLINFNFPKAFQAGKPVSAFQHPGFDASPHFAGGLKIR